MPSTCEPEDQIGKHSSELVYFMHIEKNGGTTIRHILTANYTPEALLSVLPLSRMGTDGRAKTLDGLDEDVFELITAVQDRQQTLACVAANLPFGIHKFLERPVTYFTLLREPVDRCVSCWYFAFENRYRSPLWSVLEGYDLDLQRILTDGAAYQFCNDQVRMISGSPAFNLGEDDLRKACEIIDERFFLAGVLESFDRCLKLLACRFGWHHTSFSRLNVGVKTDPSLLPAQAEKYFREANYLDILLYEWVVRKYLPKWAA